MSTTAGPLSGSSPATSGSRITGRGKTGWAVPFSTDGHGRVAKVSGNPQLEKLISLNLLPLDSANPFQDDLGIGDDAVFAVADERRRIEISRRIKAFFRRMQLADRARLVSAPKFTVDSATQELHVDIPYMNLEEDRPGNMGIDFQLRGDR